MSGDLVVMNLHATPSAFRAVANRSARRRLWDQLMRTTADMVERRKGVAVAVFGDFNASPRLVGELRRLGMRQLVRSATFGRRCIDHCWVIRTTGRAMVVEMPGDHRAVVVTFPGGPTVASWNMGNGSDSRKSAGLDRLAHHGADVICLQEAGDRHQLLDRWCESTGWRVWWGDGRPGAASVPIMWNPRAVDAKGRGSRTSSPAQWIGSAGAGPARAKAKVVNRLRIEPKQ